MAEAAAPAPSAVEGDADGATTGPPTILLLLALVFVLVGVVLLPLDDFALNVVGYVSASILTIITVGMFRRVDLDRRLSPGYRPKPSLNRVIPVLLVAGFVVAGFHVWAIATELAS